MAEHYSVRRWILGCLWICSTPVFSSTFYFVKEHKIYSEAAKYCRQGSVYQGELAVVTSNQDWDCIPQDVWFWTDQKECRLNVFNNLRCRNSKWTRLLGLRTNPFLCQTDEDLVRGDTAEYPGSGADYSYDEDLSICTSPLAPTETTPFFKSTPDPEGSTAAFNTTKNEQSESDHGWIVGLALGILIPLIVIACAVFIFIKRRKPTEKKADVETNMENRQTNERSDRLTSRIGTAIQKCKQKFQTRSQQEMYEPPIVAGQESGYDQLSRPMLPSTELVYAEPTMSSAAGIEQDELGYLVSQGSETKEYMYIDTADSVDGSPPSQEGLDCGNPVYEDMLEKREVIAGNCDKQIQDSETKPKTSSASGVPAVKVRTHEYQNSPAIEKLLKKQQEKSDPNTSETALSNGTYDDKFSTPTQMTSPAIKDGSSVTTSSNDNLSATSNKKNIKGSNIRNIILKLQGASDA